MFAFTAVIKIFNKSYAKTVCTDYGQQTQEEKIYFKDECEKY